LFAQKQPVAHTAPLKGEAHLFHNKRFIGIVVVSLLVMFAVTLPQPLTANFLQNQRGLSLARIGQLGSLGAVGSVSLMLIFGHLPAGIAMMIGQVGLVLFSLLIWRGTSILWYGVGYFFLGGYRLCRAMSVAIVQPIVREREVGLAFGVVESLNSLAYMAAPVVAGFLYDWRPVSIYPISLLVLGVTLLLSILFARRNNRKTQEVKNNGVNNDEA